MSRCLFILLWSLPSLSIRVVIRSLAHGRADWEVLERGVSPSCICGVTSIRDEVSKECYSLRAAHAINDVGEKKKTGGRTGL